ncbi:MAG: hypothetical protein WD851_20150 [Pirellulales bacterium]
MESATGKLPLPRPLAVGICDLVYRDRGTGKRFILGCFSAIHAVEFPAVHPAIGIYVDLTSGRGPVTIKVQIVDTDEVHEPVWVAELEVEFPDPRGVVELDFMAGGLSFPSPGEYRVQVWANNDCLIERRLLVNQVEKRS